MRIFRKLKIQNEQLLERLQDTCSSSYVSYCNMVDCLEDSHDMMDHEKHEKLQFIDVIEDDIDEFQSLVVVEEELELPLEDGCTFFKKCMIPLPWNQPMGKVLHFLGRCMFLPLWIFHMMKIFHFRILWVSCFFLLHPTLPNFAAFILMKYGLKVYFLWCHMKSLEFLSLILMMT